MHDRSNWAWWSLAWVVAPLVVLLSSGCDVLVDISNVNFADASADGGDAADAPDTGSSSGDSSGKDSGGKDSAKDAEKESAADGAPDAIHEGGPDVDP